MVAEIFRRELFAGFGFRGIFGDGGGGAAGGEVDDGFDGRAGSSCGTGGTDCGPAVGGGGGTDGAAIKFDGGGGGGCIGGAGGGGGTGGATGGGRGDTNRVAVVGGSGMIRGSPELDSNTCSFLVHLTSVPEAYADHLSRSQLHIHRPRYSQLLRAL